MMDLERLRDLQNFFLTHHALDTTMSGEALAEIEELHAELFKIKIEVSKLWSIVRDNFT